ncbi:MAG: endonuclease/exonuclease/phosphatase family protein [Hyphomonadaceae bacterium]
MTDLEQMLIPKSERRRGAPPAFVRFAIGSVAALSTLASLLALLSYVEPQFDLVANFAPILLAIAFVALVAAATVGRSLVLSILAAMGIAASGWLMTPDLIVFVQRFMSTPPSGPTLKIISANLLADNGDGSAFEKMVRREQPDVLILQESFGYWRKRLERLSADYPTQAGCADPSECQTVILSRFPSAGLLQPQNSTFVAARLILPSQLGGGTFEVVSVHLSRPPPMDPQLKQLDELKALSSSLSSRAVLAGDFNATPWGSSIRRLDQTLPLERHSRALFSWPTPFPLAPVDHVYAGRSWRLASIARGPRIGSDHYPIITTLVLSDTKAR